MTPDVQVWISTARNGISYHAIAASGRFTECGRYIGGFTPSNPGPIRGHVLPLAEVVDRFGSKPCRNCTGDTERVVPNVRPSRETPW